VTLACGCIFGLLASLANLEITHKANVKPPKGEQIAPLGWYFHKYKRLNREYKRLYPEGRLVLKIRVLAMLTLLCFLICAWCFGISQNERWVQHGTQEE
jgi:hypothetical protein